VVGGFVVLPHRWRGLDGLRGVGAEAFFQGLQDAGVGEEVGDRGEITERVEPEPFEELAGGAEQGGLAGAGVATHLVDVAALLQGAHHPVDVHAPDRRHLGPRDGLLVGHDRQGLQRRRRQAGALALQHEPLHVGRQVGMALEAVAPGHLHQHEPPVVGFVGGPELVAQLGHPGRRHLEQLGQQVGVDRFLRDHEDRLDGLGGLGCHRTVLSLRRRRCGP
jgi:hypothetical protein